MRDKIRFQSRPAGELTGRLYCVGAVTISGPPQATNLAQAMIQVRLSPEPNCQPTCVQYTADAMTPAVMRTGYCQRKLQRLRDASADGTPAPNCRRRPGRAHAYVYRRVSWPNLESCRQPKKLPSFSFGHCIVRLHVDFTRCNLLRLGFQH